MTEHDPHSWPGEVGPALHDFTDQLLEEIPGQLDPEPAADTSVRPEVAQAVREAEAAAQRVQCPVPDGEAPDDLAEALELRVLFNLATTGGKPLESCGGADPDVQRLEAPYRKHRTAAEATPAESRPTALDTTTEEE